MNSHFHPTRFLSLVRQNMVQDRRLYTISAIGFAGTLFILLFIIHLTWRTTQLPAPTMTLFYLATCGLAGMLYAGSAFPGFRSRERSIAFLMTPASNTEKFLWEGLSRIALLPIVLPVLFWGVYNIESAIVSAIHPSISYHYLTFFIMPDLPPTLAAGWMGKAMTASLILLVFIAPFTGTVIFGKNPLIKTLFAISIIFFFNLLLTYFVVEILHLNYYNFDSGKQMFLLPTSPQQAVSIFLITSVLANVWILAIGWFKLKEKEV